MTPVNCHSVIFCNESDNIPAVLFLPDIQSLTLNNEYLWFSVQFGNTCYCNSVLQALYYCKPFRDMVLLYKQQTKNQKKETLLTCLADLFYSVAIQKRKTGSIAPKKFIQRLRKENCEFGLGLVVCV